MFLLFAIRNASCSKKRSGSLFLLTTLSASTFMSYSFAVPLSASFLRSWYILFMPLGEYISFTNAIIFLILRSPNLNRLLTLLFFLFECCLNSANCLIYKMIVMEEVHEGFHYLFAVLFFKIRNKRQFQQLNRSNALINREQFSWHVECLNLVRNSVSGQSKNIEPNIATTFKAGYDSL